MQTVISCQSFEKTVDLLNEKYDKIAETGCFFAILSTEYDSFGNGVIGHINLYMTIINHIKKDIPYTSMYRKDNSLQPFTFDIKNQLNNKQLQYLFHFENYILL